MQSNLGGMEMPEMRALVAALMLALGIAGVRASDLPTENAMNYSVGSRAGMRVVYDFEPGVNVRAYWLAPWRHRHYFPRTGNKPKIGRYEDLSAPRHPLKPAQTFRRQWSNADAFPPEHIILPEGPRDLPPSPALLK
jgi:hypothetical protein